MQRSMFFIVALFFVFGAHASVESVVATIDKNPVMLDEALVLTVTAEGDADRNAFDSSPLLKDFVVGRTSVSSQTQIINFDSRQTTTWTTTLFPRDIGRYTIPAFTIEGVRSQPIAVQVIPVPTGEQQATRDYYVTTEVDANSVYLQQQLLYTVKLFLASNIERGSLQAPELENAEIQQLGDDRQYTDIINGKRYQIIERNFAIVPQQSGTVTIRGPVFSGEVLAPNTNQRFGFFNRTQSINRIGPDVSIEVKPIPADIDGNWLPSEFVQLNEEWPSDADFVVGEPVTRTITLTALGVLEEQLPELEQFYPPQFKLYPDQATTSTMQRNNKLVAQRVESTAIIPTKPGPFVLPAVELKWFNVTTGEIETAELPPRQIQVSPASNSNIASQPPAATSTAPPPVDAQTQTDSEKPVAVHTITGPDRWHWILGGALVVTTVGWIVSVLVLLKRKPAQRNSTQVQANSVTTNESTHFKQLVNAIAKGRPSEVLSAYNNWALSAREIDKQQGFSVTRLDQLAQNAKLKPQFDAMLASQYATENNNWNRNELKRTVSDIRKQWLARPKNHNTLAPMFPTNA